MKANKYIAPKMSQFELGSRAIALNAGSPGGEGSNPNGWGVKENNGWDDEEE